MSLVSMAANQEICTTFGAQALACRFCIL